MNYEEIASAVWDEPLEGHFSDELFERAWAATATLRRKQKRDRVFLYSYFVVIWLLFNAALLAL